VKDVFRKNLNVALLLVAAVVSVEGVTDNNHYRWENSRGEPVYSDQPPPEGVKYEVISTQSTLKRVVSGTEGAVPLEVKPSVGNEFDQVDSAEAQRSKKNPELCQRAKMNLEALTTGDKINVRNDQGEVHELSPEEMIIQRQASLAQVSVYCK